MVQGVSIISGTKNVLRTSNDLRDLVVNAGNPIVHDYHSLHNPPHILVNSVRNLQDLCSRHPNFILSQLVKSL